MGREEKRRQQQKSRQENISRERADRIKRENKQNIEQWLHDAGINGQQLMQVCTDIINKAIRTYVSEWDAKMAAYEEQIKQVNLKACESVIGAGIVALHDDFGFGQARLERFCRAVIDTIMICTEHDTLIDEAYELTGIRVNIADPMEPIDFTPRKRIKRIKPKEVDEDGST